VFGQRGGAALSQSGNTDDGKEALMTGMRNDRAHVRARNLLAAVYPAPDDTEFQRLRELATEYIQEADRLEMESRGRAAESEELISAALDAVARDYFSRAVARARSQRRKRALG
jgi:hypothetical protein